jgi:voltage-gated potassium channel
MQTSIKKKVFELIDPSHAYDDASKNFNVSMLVLISLNIVVVILETEAGIYSRYKILFEYFDLFSVGVFSIEYVLRLWSCTEHPNYRGAAFGRLRFALSPSMLIDLISILPFYVPLWGIDLRFIRAIRLFRLFRLMKMMRYSQSLSKIVNVIRSKKEELSITLFAVAILLIIASSLLYFIERNVQPDAFSSIPAAMWWGVITLTTVGYGDIYPITVMGKIVGAFIAVLGVGLFALPAGIIASGFASELHNKSSEPQICPHCGKDINNESPR